MNHLIEQYARQIYGAKFAMFAKTDVIGQNANPVYKYLAGMYYLPLVKKLLKVNINIDHQSGSEICGMLRESICIHPEEVCENLCANGFTDLCRLSEPNFSFKGC